MSKFLKLNEMDLVKGVVVAIFSSGLTALYNLLQEGTILGIQEWKSIGLAGILAGLAYLMKNVFTNKDGDMFIPEPK